LKAQCSANPIYSSPKTDRRYFRMQNNALRQRSSYGKRGRKITGKEQDAETGLYYYGARYLDPKTSRWLSGDPAMGEYLPVAPVNDEAKKHNGNLPGQGGVFNYVNLHAYHYAGNNPVKYTDPDGRMTFRELLYCFFHPIKAKKAYDNSEKAFKMAEESGLPGAHNGMQDAFRHIVWSALNTRDVGEKSAKEIGDAHEANKEQSADERLMDLENNAIGREIGKNPNISDEEIISKAMEAIDAANNSKEGVRPAIIKLPSNNEEKDYYYGKGIEDVN